MSIKNSNRQSLAVAVVAFAFADFVDGLAQAALELPAGATVVGGAVYVDEAFDATTNVAVGDADAAGRYGAALDLATAGVKPLTATGFQTASKSDVVVTLTGVPTVGKARLVVQYIEAGKSEWTQG